MATPRRDPRPPGANTDTRGEAEQLRALFEQCWDDGVPLPRDEVPALHDRVAELGQAHPDLKLGQWIWRARLAAGG